MGLDINSIDDFQVGTVIAINKPYQWTSFDLVRKIKNLIVKKLREHKDVRLKSFKVGHAGTLDPLAEGLMIVCTGKATKKINEMVDFEKEYVATIELGKTTPSFDLETEFDKAFSIDHINKELVINILESFVGEQLQVPPVYSAKNINGKRAYEYARKGESIELKANKITITEIELVSIDLPYIIIRIVCSKGTYIRSLANDIGVKLESGGYLKNLVRTRIGNYRLDSSITLEEFEKKIANLQPIQ